MRRMHARFKKRSCFRACFSFFFMVGRGSSSLVMSSRISGASINSANVSGHRCEGCYVGAHRSFTLLPDVDMLNSIVLRSILAFVQLNGLLVGAAASAFLLGLTFVGKLSV